MSRAPPRGRVSLGGGGSTREGAPSSCRITSHHAPYHSASRPLSRPPSRPSPNYSNQHRFQLIFIDPKTKITRNDVIKVSFGRLDAPLTRLYDTKTN